MTDTRHLHPPHGAPRSGAPEAIRGHDARPGPPCPPGAPARRRAAERGQAAVLIVGALVAVLVGALVLGAVARGVNREGEAQRAADLAALAGARAMHAAYARRFEPAVLDRRANPSHVSKTDYLALGRAAAEATGRANGIKAPQVSFPDHTSFAPVRIQVRVRDRFTVGDGNARRGTTLDAHAQAELAPPEADGLPSFATGGGYDGPLEYRQGKPMRPDVARAFDRLAAAARGDGVELVINSAFRSDAEQAELFRRHPDPKWVAPPGKSLHRYGTELDLGPSSAYGWLAGHAREFHFIQRYSWEPERLCSGSAPSSPSSATRRSM